jgi:hypothetical protein
MFRSLLIAAATLPWSLLTAGTADAGCSCGGGASAAAGPPSAPAGGYTYRSYSVQPQVFAPSRSMYWSSRPGMMSSQNQIINRRLRPGTYSFH